MRRLQNGLGALHLLTLSYVLPGQILFPISEARRSVKVGLLIL